MATSRSLLGSRGRALYPPLPSRHSTNGQSSSNGASLSSSSSSSPSLYSRQSLIILSVGILFGYSLLPILMINVLDTNTRSMMMNNEHPALLSPRYQKNNGKGFDYLVKEKDARRLTTTPAAEEEALEEEQSPPDLPVSEEEEGGTATGGTEGEPEKVQVTVPRQPEPVEEKQQQHHHNHEQEDLKLREEVAVIATSLTEVEKRLVEDRDILSHQSMPTATTPHIMKTRSLPDHQRMKILVTGGAGFVGSHLVDKLMMEGHEVIVVDNFFTGQKKNIAHWLHHPNFSLVVHDVTEPIQLEVDQIYHLACPASPPHYQYNPVKTIKTSTMGTLNMLGLAKRVRARILLTSTSEIYGDPKVHPQPESYWGNVNTIGPRSCYDEGKRVAETMMYSYRNQNKVDVRVARIFNTFGPRMHPNDGRVVSNFIIQALQDKKMTIYGEGKQTRSFQYVSDLVAGLHALMNGGYDLPVNLGNPDEYSVGDFAKYIKNMTKSGSEIVFLEKSQDDPSQRKPDITTAKEQLGWEPRVTVEEGLRKTIAYFASVLKEAGEIIPTGPGAAKPEA